MGKKAICEECGKTITSKNDLVTTTALLKLTTYCKDCYVERIKSFSSLFVSNTPLNGKYSNVMSVIVLIALIPIMFIQDPLKYLLIILVAVYLLYRLASYLLYERHLD